MVTVMSLCRCLLAEFHFYFAFNKSRTHRGIHYIVRITLTVSEYFAQHRAVVKSINRKVT